MNSKSALFGCLFVFSTCVFTPVGDAISAPFQLQEHDKLSKSDQVDLLLLLVDNSMNLRYFIDEVGIVAKQQTKIQSVIKQAVKDYVAIRARTIAARPENLENEESDVEGLIGRLNGDINEILLPHQQSLFLQLLRQRNLLKRHNCESFELPFFLRSSFELSKTELVNVEKQFEAVSYTHLTLPTILFV